MGASFTYNPSFGVKITVGLPRHVGRDVGFEICDAIDALIEERWGQGQRSSIRPSETASYPSIEPETTKSPAERTALKGGAMPEMRFVPWPESGPVTLNMVVKAWDIGKSTFRKQVIEGRSGSDENVWAAEKITSQLKALGIIRRYEAID